MAIADRHPRFPRTSPCLSQELWINHRLRNEFSTTSTEHPSLWIRAAADRPVPRPCPRQRRGQGHGLAPRHLTDDLRGGLRLAPFRSASLDSAGGLPHLKWQQGRYSPCCSPTLGGFGRPSFASAPTAAWRPWRGSRPWLDTEPGRRPGEGYRERCGRCGRWGGSRRPRDGPRLLCGRWRRYGWRRCRGWSGRRRSVVAEPAERVAQDRQHDDRHGHDVVDRASTHRLGPSNTAIISGMSSPASSASPDEAGEGFGELGGGHGCCPGAVPVMNRTLPPPAAGRQPTRRMPVR